MSSADKNDPTPFTLVEARDVVTFPLVARIMQRPFVVDATHYDIPYLAGYSNDGRTIFIDRSLGPWVYERLTRPTSPFLALHEHSEKSVADALVEARGRELERLLILLRMTHADDRVYFHSHGVAAALEEYAVRMQFGQAGLAAYKEFMRGEIAKVEDERIRRVPTTLDMLPYQGSDPRDVHLRLVMEARMAA